MREPMLVADCVRAMRDAVALPVTVKHRIGLDLDEEFGSSATSWAPSRRPVAACSSCTRATRC